MVKLGTAGKWYGVRQPWVVLNLAAEIAAGQLIRVDGPDGAGKSTLLRVVAAVTLPSRGPHDPTRLSGSAAQRWTLDGTGSLSRTTVAAPPVTIIEVSGWSIEGSDAEAVRGYG